MSFPMELAMKIEWDKVIGIPIALFTISAIFLVGYSVGQQNHTLEYYKQHIRSCEQCHAQGLNYNPMSVYECANDTTSRMSFTVEQGCSDVPPMSVI